MEVNRNHLYLTSHTNVLVLFSSFSCITLKMRLHVLRSSTCGPVGQLEPAIWEAKSETKSNHWRLTVGALAGWVPSPSLEQV